MSDQETKTKIFPLSNRGVISKRDPATLRDGEMIGSQNIYSIQEGTISPRFATRKLGTMGPGALAPHTIAKLPLSNQTFSISDASNSSPIVITTDSPHGWQNGFLVSILGVNGNTAANSATGSPWRITVIGGPNSTQFSLNGSAGNGAYTNGGEATLTNGDPSIRYIGEGGNIWRTLDDYVTFTNVAQNVMGSIDPFNRWSEVSYNAGATGNPFAYFACPGAMLKDQGNSPFPNLESWGISPGLAAAAASNAAGVTYDITSVSSASVDGNLVYLITTSSPNGFVPNESVSVIGVINPDGTNSTANGTWQVGLIIDAENFTLANSVYDLTYAAPLLSTGGTVAIAGPNTYEPGATAYDYVFCYRDPNTASQGNPSPFMQSTLAVQSQNGIITVTVWGSPDPKIIGPQSITVYRRGGSYSDGLFRFVGYVTNPGVDATGEPLPATLIDTNADINLLYANQVQFDNDPPVTSALRFPINAVLTGGPFAAGWNAITLSQAVAGLLTIGTQVIVGPSTNQETCRIAALPYPAGGSNFTCLLYFQLTHVTGEPALIDSVNGQPCSVGITAFDQIYLAGDQNNPSTLYQSKAGFPESFPTIDALGNAHALLVGSPSNPIMNLTEFRGNVLCLNQVSLSEVSVFQGVMAGPYDTPAERGLIARWGFVNTGYLVFYLANDGIYSWDGSQSRKRTEAIDPAFHGISIGGTLEIAPVSYVPSDLAYARMEYYRNQLYFLYSSGGGLANMHVLRYDVLYDRWEPELYYDGFGPLSNFFLEKDTNAFVFTRYLASGNTISQNDQFGTMGSTDEFVTPAGTDGFEIEMAFQTGFYRLEEPNRVKLVQDIFIELANQDPVTLQVFYDYASVADPIDQFTIPASPSVGGPVTSVLANGLLIQAVSPNHQLISGNRIIINGPANSPNGEWTVSVIDQNNFTLNGSIFNAAYVGGGTFTLIQRRQVTLPLQLSAAPQALSSGKEAFAVSVLISCSSTHFNTFYALGFRFLDRDAIQQGITSDWMNLGSNNDKRLYQLHLEHNMGGMNVTLQLDIRYGINGTLQANNVAQWLFNSSEKTTVTVPIPEAGFPNGLTICKSVRLRPVYTPQGNFRIFIHPVFDSETLPPDIALFTPWKDFGYMYEKIARNLIVDADTQNVPCQVTLQADGGNIQTFTIQTTANDRKRYLPLASGPEQTPQPIGRIFRLTGLPGAGGKFQLFDWILDFIKEPGIVPVWDSYEQGFGSLGFKLLKQIWLFYLSPYPVNFLILTDGGATFYQIQLPAHPTRAVERFYIPDATGTSQRGLGILQLGSSGNLFPALTDFTQQAFLTGPANIKPVTGATIPAQIFLMQLIQDAEGGNTVTWDAFYTGLSGFALDTTGGTQACLLFQISNDGTFAVLIGILANGSPIAPPVTINKSKIFRFQLTAVGAVESGTTGLKFYVDESGVEFCLTGAGQRSAYQKISLTEVMKLQP